MGLPDKALTRVNEEKNFVERVAHLIPGYRGYQEREKVRETDRLVRDELARVLKVSVGNLDSCFNALVQSNNPISGDVDRTKLKADRIAEKIRHAEYGYAGLFDPIKIGTEELHSLLRFDSGLASSAQHITESSKKLLGLSLEGGDLRPVLASLETSLDDFDNVLGQRKQYMQGLKGESA